MWGGDWYDFYIVEKENDAEEVSEESVEVVWAAVAGMVVAIVSNC
jgi:hypothetical protein